MAALRSANAQSQSRANGGGMPPPASAPLLPSISPLHTFSSTAATIPLTSGSISSSSTTTAPTATTTTAASMFPPSTGSTPPSTSAGSISFVADDRGPSTSPRERISSKSASPTAAQMQSGGTSSSSLSPQQRPPTGAPPTSDEVEAVIKMATSTRPTPDGRPPPGKDTRTQLFVGNLPYRVRWQDLKDLFRKAGTVLRADVALTPAYPTSVPTNSFGSLSASPIPSATFSPAFPQNPSSFLSPLQQQQQQQFGYGTPMQVPPPQIPQKSLGYGTVLLSSAEDAGRAVDMFNGFCWQGRTLEVRLDRLAPEVDSGVNLGMMPVGPSPPSTSAGANTAATANPAPVPSADAAAIAQVTAAGATVPIAALASTLGNLSLNQINQLATLGQLGQLAQLASANASGVPGVGSNVSVSPTAPVESGRSSSSGVSAGASANSAQVTPAPGGGVTVTLSGVGGTEGGAFHVPAPVHAEALKSLSPGLGSGSLGGNGGVLGGGNGNGNGNGNGGGLGGLRGDPLLGLDRSPLPNSSTGAGLSGLGRRDEGLFDVGSMGRGRSPWLSGSNLGGNFERPLSRGLSALGVGRNLFVGNLPFHTQWQDLKDLFRQASLNGPILRADVNLGPDGRSRGFGTVSFANDEDAERAVAMFNGFEYGGRILRVHFDKYASTPVSAANVGLLNLGARSSPLNLLQPQLTGSGQTNFGSNFSPFSHAAAQFSQQQQQQQIPYQMPSSQGVSLEAVRDALAAQQQQHYQQQQLLQQQQLQQHHQQQQQQGSGLLGGDAPAYTFLEELSREERSDLSLGSLAVLASKSRRGSTSTSARSGSFGAGSSLASFESSAMRSTSTSTSLQSMGPSLSAPPASQLGSDTNEDSLKKTPPPVSSASTSSLPSTVSPTSPTLAQRRTSNNGNGNGGRSAAQASLSLLTNTQTQGHSPRASGTHPAHPGPISLPPPSVVSGFPIPMQHTLSPLLASPLHHPYAQQTTPGAYPPSPYSHHPPYATPGQPQMAYSPLHHPAHGVLMTPHGIPPITPSMPSFSFAAQPTPVASMGGMSIASPPPHAHAGIYHPHHPHHARYSSHGAQIPQHPGLVHTASFSPGMMMSPGQAPFYGPPAPIGKASGSGLRHGGETAGEGEEGEGLNQSANEYQQGMGSPLRQSAPYMQHAMGSPGYFVQMEPSGYFPPMPPPSDGGYFPSVGQSEAVAHEILRDPSSSSDERRRRMSTSSVLSEAETDFGMGDARSSAATSRTGDEISTPESITGEESKEKERKDARSYSMSSGEGASRDRDRRPGMPKNHSDEAPGHAQTVPSATSHQTRSRSVAEGEGSSVSRPPVVGSRSDQSL